MTAANTLTAICAVALLRDTSFAVPTETSIPLCAGLTIVTAVSQPEGDYESIKTVQSVTDRDITLKYSSEQKEHGVIAKMTAMRTVRREDLRSATLYHHRFANRGPATIAGTTAIGVSAAVLQGLKTRGEAQLGLLDPVALAVPADRGVHPNVYDYQMVETIQRVGTAPVPLAIMVNGETIQVPAIRARGDYTGDKAEFFFLDDDNNPLALKYRIGRDVLDVVRINARCDARSAIVDPAAGEADRLEQALSKDRRADVYSIYFSFNSDLIRDESEPTLKAIGEVMRRRPDWRLAIAGHTDGIGGDTYNVELSKRRAAAVRRTLSTRFGVADARLTADGLGKSQPKDTNDTLEGRARNRRVELVRIS